MATVIDASGNGHHSVEAHVPGKAGTPAISGEEDLGTVTSGNITVDLSKQVFKKVTIGGNCTVAAPTPTGVAGGCEILVTNDATGGYTLDVTAYDTVTGSYQNAADRKQYIRISVHDDGTKTIEFVDHGA